MRNATLKQHITTIDAIIILVHVVLFCYSVKRGLSRFLVMALTPGLTDGSKRERNRTHPLTHTHTNTQILMIFLPNLSSVFLYSNGKYTLVNELLMNELVNGYL